MELPLAKTRIYWLLRVVGVALSLAGVIFGAALAFGAVAVFALGIPLRNPTDYNVDDGYVTNCLMASVVFSLGYWLATVSILKLAKREIPETQWVRTLGMTFTTLGISFGFQPYVLSNGHLLLLLPWGSGRYFPVAAIVAWSFAAICFCLAKLEPS